MPRELSYEQDCLDYEPAAEAVSEKFLLLRWLDPKEHPIPQGKKVLVKDDDGTYFLLNEFQSVETHDAWVHRYAVLP